MIPIFFAYFCIHCAKGVKSIDIINDIPKGNKMDGEDIINTAKKSTIVILNQNSGVFFIIHPPIKIGYISFHDLYWLLLHAQKGQ